MKKLIYILALLITGFVNAQAIIVDGQLYGGVGAPGESGEWGSITGTLSDQPDLQSALNLKLNTSSYTAADVLSKLLTVDGSGSGLDADLLDGISEGSFLRSDVTSIKTGGNLIINDNLQLSLGSSGDIRFFHDGTTNWLQLNNGDFQITDGATQRFLFSKSTGNLTTTGFTTSTQFRLSALNTACLGLNG